MQSDGNLVMYTASGGSTASSTPNSAAAPRGTLVCYRTSTSGHVAISLGNGTVISTSARGNVIGISPVTGWFTPLLGWAPSPW